MDLNVDLEQLERDAVGYFLRAGHPVTGLIADSSREGSPCSIAAVGLGLSAFLAGVERGFLSRSEAAARTLAALRFFRDSPQGEEPDATGHRGFYYHFLDMATGRRVWNCELSMIDTTILIAGVLSCGSYFSAATDEEREIREISRFLYERVDWAWAARDLAVVSMGWKPEAGFITYSWEGYSEALLLYLLGLGSPTHPLPEASYRAWTATYQWENLYDVEFLFAAPLFIHQLSHLWIDFRGIQDELMRDMRSDYFENSRRATQVQQRYAMRNPKGFQGYGENNWGVTAGLGPGFLRRREKGGIERRFYGYVARGVPFGPDDGTLAPWAVAASLPFAPEIVLPALAHVRETYPEVVRDGLLTSFNPTFNTKDSGPAGWISPEHYGLDQGPVAIMIENFRSGLLWNLMRECPAIVTGLRRAGFRKGGGRSRR
ncbi:MAG TPA: glucoamylase family protein [Thermoanaerobaculia bacterium]|nr:glucoamylase family protein [Thermoanaerobaculia bacterium]